MSYARFSTNAFQSDVYAFKHAQGHYQIYVAANRCDVDRSALPPKPEEGDENYAAHLARRQKAVMDVIENAERQSIGGPYDGDSYQEETAAGALKRLEHIRTAGYNVPQGAIDQLREET